MSLSPGAVLSHFEIVSILGRGGMGDVFRALDLRLGREVAIKLLSEEFLRNPECLTRLHNEARVLAALSHPAIAAIHGLEEDDGCRFLVLEFVPGETLAEQLSRGPLSLEKALDVARQVTLGLAAAHEKGIIHRDLKPANVKVAPDGRVKILDFGIAKTLSDSRSRNDGADPTTITWESTDEGVVLGTAAYMSPEQTRGRELDRRTDIWSFGCLLYESLTGVRTFSGETVTDIIAAVLGREVDWKTLPAATPERIRVLLRRCLERDRDRRLHDIADARIEIDDVSTATPADETRTLRPRRRDVVRGLGGGLLISALLASAGWIWSAHRPAAVRRLYLGALPALPRADTRANLELAVSRDGRRVSYVGAGDTPQLYVREMDSLEVRPVRGTQGASQPFFSPDGLWLGFTAHGKLWKVDVNGGQPSAVCNLPASAGAAWGPDDTIVFAPGCTSGPSDCGLFRVSGKGGEPQPITRADAAQGEVHSCPRLLPSGRVLYVSERSRGPHTQEVRAVSLSNGSSVRVLDGRGPLAFASGHLLYRRSCALLSVAMDPRTLLFTAPESILAQDVLAFDATDEDTLFFASGCRSSRPELVAVHSGEAQPITALRQAYSSLAVSPEGDRVAVVIASGLDRNIAVLDRQSGQMTAVTEGEGQRDRPAWTPDGQRIAYQRSGPEDLRGLYWTRTEPRRTEEPLLLSTQPVGSISFAPDGASLVYERVTDKGGETWWLSLVGSHDTRLLLPGAANPRLSPDGRWLAYETQEGSTREVWMSSYPDLAKKHTIAREGTDPAWARDGKALYYRTTALPTRLFRVTLEGTSDLRPMEAVSVFESPVPAGHGFDTVPTTDSIVAVRYDASGPPPVVVVSHWSSARR